MGTPSIADFTRRQHALVSHEQALTVMSEWALRHALRRGAYERVRRNVYRVSGAPESWEQHVLAACLAYGDGAVASFSTAAALWGLDGFDRDGIEITVAGRDRTRLRAVTVHDSTVIGARHVARRSRIPVTSAARTLCDLTWHLPVWVLGRHVDDALRRRLTTLRNLRAVAADLDGRGRRRSTVMREILDQRDPSFHPGDSAQEVRLARVLAEAGLPGAIPQHPVRIGRHTFRIDLAYVGEGVAIEYDGYPFHRERTDFDRDRARGNELELAGWLVLRFTSASSDRAIVATVADALARRRAA